MRAGSTSRKETRGQETRMTLGLVGLLAMALVLGLAAGAAAEHPGVRSQVAAQPELPDYKAEAKKLEGAYTISGSDTMKPLMTKLAASFRMLHPGVRFAVEGEGTKSAVRKFLFGYTHQRRQDKARSGHDGGARANLLASSRELTADEIAIFKSHFGYEPLQIPIALDAVAIYVHAQNPIQGLTLDQVDAIFDKERKRGYKEDITTWGQLGLQGEWSNQPLDLYGRDKKSGTRDFFKRVALLDGELKGDIEEAVGSANEILAIGKDLNGIGYAGIGYLTSFVKAVPIAEKPGAPFIEPNHDSVLKGTYPLRRYLFLYVNHDPNSEYDPVIREILAYINSEEGQKTVARAKLYPLPSDVIAQNLARIQGAPMHAQVEAVAAASR